MPIGVFDSGIGGLTVLRALRDAAPAQSFVYFGDQQNAPYGVRPPDEVRALTKAGVDRLFDEGCDLVILACNTASAIALRPLQQDWLPERAPGRRVLGVFVPVIEALIGRRWTDQGPPTDAPGGARSVLFFATPATVANGAFEEELQKRAVGLTPISVACPGLADAVEAGDEAAAAGLAAQYAAEALGRVAPGPAAAVLGCTHYPLAFRAFRAALPLEIPIFSQPVITAGSLARYLERKPEFEDLNADLRLLTTGNASRTTEIAARFFGEQAAFQAV
ncbi:MAG: aspartate/glutamate racemase family protein [Neomegalonema sp.]|nr:aspartate/glutamate racemase family protein [Neomegalonema sp.]